MEELKTKPTEIRKSISDRVLEKTTGAIKESPISDPVQPIEIKQPIESKSSDSIEIPTDILVPSKEVEDSEEIDPAQINKETFIKTRKAYQAKLSKLEEQLKNKPEISENEIKLREELAETKKRLASYSLSEDEDFLDKYDRPMTEGYNRIVEIVKSLEGNEELESSAIRLGYKERIKLFNEKLPDATGIVLPMLAQLDSLIIARKKAIDNFDSEKTKLKQLRFEREKKQKEDLHGSSFNAALKTLTESEKHIFFIKSKTDDKWNSLVDKRIDMAKTMIDSDDAYLKSETALRAVVSEDYRMAYERARDRVLELEKELGIRSKARSGGSVGSSASSDQPTDKPVRKARSGLEVAELLTKGYR